MGEPENRTRLRIASQACAHLAVKTPTGDLSSGCGFHIGKGYYVTARHVVQDNAIEEITRSPVDTFVTAN